MLSAADFRFLRSTALIVLGLTISLLYYFEISLLFPVPCLFKLVTGWNCWGCGGQHAFRELLHGHFLQALQLNALVFPVVFLLGYMLISEAFLSAPSYRFLHKRSIQITALAILLGFTILRNVL